MSNRRRTRLAAGLTVLAWILVLPQGTGAQPLPAAPSPPMASPSLAAPRAAQPSPGSPLSTYGPRREIELQYSIWPEARSVAVGYAPLVMSGGSLSVGIDVGDGAGGPFGLLTVAARAHPWGASGRPSSAVMGLAYGVAERGEPAAPRGLWLLLGGGIQPRLHSHFALRAEMQVLVPARRRDDHPLLRIGIGVVIGRD
jgi:hypothetical protein